MAVKKKSDVVEKVPRVKPRPKSLFIATNVPQFHPFARVNIPTALPGVELDPEDSWTQSQMAAGIIKCLT